MEAKMQMIYGLVAQSTRLHRFLSPPSLDQNTLCCQ